jgi:serine/threonine protein kinase
MIDEIEEPPTPDECAAIVLKYYDCHIGEIVKDKGLSAREARSAGSRVLQALCAVHATGYIYTDVKPANILVNVCQNGDMRFNDVCLADPGDAVSTDSVEATNGYPYGTPLFRSPEATLMMPFTTAHDIWSFGATVGSYHRLISLACKFIIANRRVRTRR